MARRKQARPTRPGGFGVQFAGEASTPGDEENEGHRPTKRSKTESPREIEDGPWKTFLSPDYPAKDSKVIAEVKLLVSTSASESGLTTVERETMCKHATLRIRMEVTEAKGKLWTNPNLTREEVRVHVGFNHVPAPATSESSNVALTEMDMSSETFRSLLVGELDCPDVIASAVAFLVHQGHLGVHPMPSLTCNAYDHLSREVSEVPGKLSLFITRKAFLGFEVYNKRPLWMAAMQALLAWLRPDVMSSALAKGMKLPFREDEEIERNLGPVAAENNSSKRFVFDPSAIYDAIKPTGTEPALEISSSALIPELRPYQRRAANWMVNRERGHGSCFESLSETSNPHKSDDNQQSGSTNGVNSTSEAISDSHPLWLPVRPLDGSPNFFFNPHTYCQRSGAVSLEPHDFVSYVRGGILADEMGLGKTVELLACILANPYRSELVPSPVDAAKTDLEDKIASRKCDRVECACGAVEEDENYEETWVQCDVCDAWQHSTCVGYVCPPDLREQNLTYSGTRSSWKSSQQQNKRHRNGALARNNKRGSQNQAAANSRRKLSTVRHVCGACAEMIGGVEVKGASGSTLVVCPPLILQQWQDEILRHTREGSLRVVVYHGVEKGATIVMGGKESTAGNQKRLQVVSANDLAAADIVLTTYDTLRADLSHDSDKSKSNQRSLRYLKRYPVIPTPLTRLRWWRVCLDEAQMVESNTSRVTEMALLLDAQYRWCVTGTPIQRGLDDLYGLLKFLQAEPFDQLRNWNVALRQPYEIGDPHVVEYMHRFLGAIMWRSSKLQVQNELKLPLQDENVSWLRFSPVEAHFYRQQHEKCAVRARTVVAKYGRQQTVNPGRSNALLSIEAAGPGRSEIQAGTVAENGATDDHRDGYAGQRDQHQPEITVGEPVENSSQTSDIILTDSRALNEDDRPLLHSEASILSTSLLRLRQACCHPQIGTAGIRSLQQRSPMTMDEILQVLVDKTRVEAEEAQRVLIGALNGLAALSAIENDIPLAVSIYREALALSEENAGDIDVDPLQKLHTLHNLADILGMGASSSGLAEGCVARAKMEPQGTAIPRTLRDDVLVKQCEEMKSTYMANFHAKLASELREFEISNRQVREAKQNCEESGGTSWWLEVLSRSERHADGGQKDIVFKIRSHLLETDNLGKRGRHRNASSLALRFRDISGMKYLVQKELEALESSRDQAVQQLKDMNKTMMNPTSQDVDQIINCPRDSENVKGPLCAHCQMDDIFQMYENRLLLLRTSAAEADGVVSAEDAVNAQHRILAHRRISGSREQIDVGKGSQSLEMENYQVKKRRRSTATGATEAEVLRAPSETEQILSIIRSHARTMGELNEMGTKHLQVFEAMKKEYTYMRALAKVQREVLYNLDELNMATTRLCLRLPGEVIENDVEKLVKLHPEEVPQKNVQLTVEKFDGQKDLTRAKGQLRYLKGLAVAREQLNKKSTSREDTVQPKHGLVHSDEETCPVCQEKLGSQLMVLPCGHLLCCKCCMVMIERTSTSAGTVAQKRILCPTCRQRTHVGDIALVDNTGNRNAIASQIGQIPGEDETSEDASLEVKGSYGTKIEAVVKRLLWVKFKDPLAKVLVFSTWHEVLDVIQHALSANNITFARVKGTQLNAPIQKFRGVSLSPGSSKSGKATSTDENVQVLLLPIERGGNGLNLVEAQHVVLVEPTPNPAIEAQAINRVHRIGQTRDTHIHRFIVSDTVEESVYWLGKKKAELLKKFPGRTMVSRKNHYLFSLNDVSSLFASTELPPPVNGSESSPTRPPPPNLTPSQAAAAAAEARLRSNLSSQNGVIHTVAIPAEAIPAEASPH